MTACAKLTASASAPRRPSRTSRRQVNNWPADNPYLRAVADTRRGALALSATIRRFSSGVQRRRAPVWITSSRDTFDIIVCSVIRLCLRASSLSARRPSPEAYPIPLRRDFDASQLRGFARKTKDGPQARRLLALAAIYDGGTRFNARGPDGLLDGKSPGQPSARRQRRSAGSAFRSSGTGCATQ